MLAICFLAVLSTAALRSDEPFVAPLALAASVDAQFADYAHPDVPGCAVAIAIDGKIIFEKGYGAADLEHDIAIAPDTVFDIGSTSKQFTASAIVLLALDGKLSLDDDIREHLPEFPDYGTPIRIRHLLFHTSGIRDYNVLLTLDGQSESDWSTDHLAMRCLERQRGLCFPPGSRHEYSNSGYFLLAQIVERASGQHFSEFVQSRLFDRLGMGDSHVHDDRMRIVKRRAISYLPIPGDRFGIFMSGWEQTGDGAVMTTVRDLLRWTHEFETHAAFGDDFHALMNRIGSLDDGTALTYGMGLIHRRFHELELIEHGGAWVGYRADLARLPTRRIAIALLSNRGDFDSSAALERVLSSLLPEAPPTKDSPATPAIVEVPLDSKTIDPWLGLYRHAETGDVVTFAIEEGKLVAKRSTGDAALACVAPTEFINPKTSTRYTLVEGSGGSGGSAHEIVVRPTNSPERRLVPHTPWQPAAKELAKFVGIYRSDEVLAPGIITLGEHGIRVHLGSKDPNDAAELPPLEADAFGVPGFQVRFARDAAGQPISFEFITRSVAGLHYRRSDESRK